LHPYFATDETNDLAVSPDVIITADGDLTYVLIQSHLTAEKNAEIAYHL